jgi:hypothetical protein
MKPVGWLARAKQKDSNAFATIRGRGQNERLVAVLEVNLKDVF